MIETNKIYNSDCYIALKNIPDKSINLILTDPPYKIGFDKPDYVKKRGIIRKYVRDINYMSDGINIEILDDFKRVLKNMNLIIFGSKFQLKFYLDWIYEQHYNWELIIWHKKNPNPLMNSSFLPDTEYIFFIWENRKLTGNYHTKSKFYDTNVEKNNFDHPAVKPLHIIKNLILNATDEGDIVLDPFIGTGTTALACLDLNRKYIGYEIEKKYFDIAQSRINSHEIEANGLL